MTIEKQCCTLWQAKRLKELGVEQVSQFYWSDFAGSKNELYIRKELGLYGVEVDYFSGLFFVRPGIESGLSAYSAYTVAELGDLIKPIVLPIYWPLWDEWCFKGYGDPRGYGSEAEARAAWLIYLIENNRIAVKEINKRLQNA